MPPLVPLLPLQAEGLLKSERGDGICCTQEAIHNCMIGPVKATTFQGINKVLANFYMW